MTQESLKRANEIINSLHKINKAVDSLKVIRTNPENSFKISDSNEQAYFDSFMVDPMAKEGCKALILSNLEGKKKQLEAEFEKL